MSAPFLKSVNVGQPRAVSGKRAERTAIRKHAVTGPVLAHRLGIEGDRVGNPDVHGGLDQAVYAFAREDLDRWAAELGTDVRNGQFGENLTTTGIDVNEAEIGARWRIGGALLEVASVRTPCNDFKGWMGLSGFDNRAWVKRFTAAGRPGPYLRVLEPGDIGAGDPVDVVHTPGHGVTVSTVFRALTTDRTLLPTLLVADALPAEIRAKAGEFVHQGEPATAE